jgi:hypothetical protein
MKKKTVYYISESSHSVEKFRYNPETEKPYVSPVYNNYHKAEVVRLNKRLENEPNPKRQFKIKKRIAKIADEYPEALI